MVILDQLLPSLHLLIFLLKHQQPDLLNVGEGITIFYKKGKCILQGRWLEAIASPNGPNMTNGIHLRICECLVLP